MTDAPTVRFVFKHLTTLVSAPLVGVLFSQLAYAESSNLLRLPCAVKDKRVQSTYFLQETDTSQTPEGLQSVMKLLDVEWDDCKLTKIQIIGHASVDYDAATPFAVIFGFMRPSLPKLIDLI